MGLRWRRLALLVLVLCVLAPSVYVFWQARSGAHLGRLQDDGLYWTAAHSLARDAGYRIESLPGQPYQTKYPPLYPLLLSAIWRLDAHFPGNLRWAVLLNWFFWLAYLGASMLWFRRMFTKPLARWASLVLLATNVCAIFYALQIMAEALFAALLLSALLAATKATEEARGTIWAAVAAILGSLAFLAKTAALPVLLTIPLVLFAKRRYGRAAVFLVLSVPVAAGWMLWSANHRLPTADPVQLYYTDYLGFYRVTVGWHLFPRMVRGDFAGYLRALTSMGLGLQNAPVAADLLGGIFCIVALVRLLARTGCSQLTLAAVGYGAQFLVWNFPPDERFLFPFLPVFIAAILSEVTYLYGILSRSAGGWARVPLGLATAGFLLICFAKGLFWQSPSTYETMVHLIRHVGKPLPEKRDAYAWLGMHSEPGAVVVAYDDPDAYLYSGHPAIRNEVMPQSYLMGDLTAIESPITTLAGFARAHAARYVVTAPDDYAINAILGDSVLRDRLVTMNPGLRTIYDQRGVRIYAVEHAPAIRSN